MVGKDLQIYVFDGESGEDGYGGGGGGTDPEYDEAGDGGDGVVIIHHVGVPCFEGLASECETFMTERVRRTRARVTSPAHHFEFRMQPKFFLVSNQATLRLNRIRRGFS